MTSEESDLPGDDGLIEANGDGADLFDDPSLFYLTYREHIERWSALKDRASQAVDQYFLGFREGVEVVADREGLAVDTFKTGNRFRSLLLWPPTAAVVLDDGEPPIAIGLRWPHKRPAIEEAGHAPRVGIRVAPRQEQLREQFLSAGEPDTRQLRDQHGYRSDRRWPAFREVPGAPGWWADLDSYRSTLIEALQTTIGMFGDRLRSVHPHG
jgi:hypothetical protein